MAVFAPLPAAHTVPAGRGRPGESREDHQPETDGGVDADEHRLADDVARQHERRDHQQRQQHAIGHEVAAVRKQPYVVFVIGLEQEPHP